MEVLNFLQWFELHYGVNGVGTAIGAIQTVTLKMQMVSDFYLQFFVSSDIAELFEGWDKKETKLEYSLPKEKFIYYSNGGVTINLWNIDGDEQPFIDRDVWNYNGIIFIPPKTLNDFISDCQRAGIELTWKPEIVNKYFGGVE